VRKKTIIFLLAFVGIFMSAQTLRPVGQKKKTKQEVRDSVKNAKDSIKAVKDSLKALEKQRKKMTAEERAEADSIEAALQAIADSIAEAERNDTTKMDSLQLSIWKHNKAIDDSLALDSAIRKRKNGHRRSGGILCR